jgi:hypothetical protein
MTVLLIFDVIGTFAGGWLDYRENRDLVGKHRKRRIARLGSRLALALVVIACAVGCATTATVMPPIVNDLRDANAVLTEWDSK